MRFANEQQLYDTIGMCQVILGKNYKPLIYIASKLAAKIKQSCR